jgi:hypothetical protein
MAMLNEVPGVPASGSSAARRPWYRFRPHPASAVVWLYALLLMWYAAPRGPFFPKPGTIIVAHVPQMLQYGKLLLAAYWVCAAVAFGTGALRRRQPSLLRTLEVVLAVLVAVFGGAYAAARLGGPAVLNVALMVALMAGAPAFVIAALLTSSKQPRSALVPLALSLLVVFPLGLPELPVFSGAWQDLAEVKAPDGRMYHVQLKQVMQGRDYGLTEELGRSRFFLRTRVLGDVRDITSLWPTLVRPAGSGPRWGTRQLVLSPDGQWLVYVTESYPRKDSYDICFAYDLRAKRLYRWADRAQLSPFLLVGPDDALDSRDVKTLRAWMAEPYTPDEALAPEVLERDSHHPNPRVRALVAELRAGPHPAPTESPRHD